MPLTVYYSEKLDVKSVIIIRSKKKKKKSDAFKLTYTIKLYKCSSFCGLTMMTDDLLFTLTIAHIYADIKAAPGSIFA